MTLSLLQLSDQLQNQEQRLNDLHRQQGVTNDAVVNLGDTLAVVAQAPPVVGQIDNILRNSKLRHSWDTWVNLPAVPGNQQEEAAHVFTQEKDTSVQGYDGVIALGDDVLLLTPEGDAEFRDPDDIGSEIVVEGAGAAGADHVTTIASVTGTGECVLTDPAITGVTAARVRWRLQTLEMTATTTGTPTTNSSLKNSAHTNFAGNITDPLWNKPNGRAELGTTNTINFPLGYWNKDTSSWVFQNLVEPSKVYYFICRVARKNATIKPRGFLGFHLWDASAGKKQVIEGGRFLLQVAPHGTPAATVSSDYKVIARTDKGDTLESNVVTVNRPSDASFVTNEIYEILQWALVPGVRIFEIYRKTGATFVKLAQITNSNTIYLDQGAVLPDVVTEFPTGDIQRRKAEAFTRPRDLENIIVDGAGDWNLVRVPIFVPASYDTRVTTKQWGRAGLSVECDREVTDGVTIAASIVVESETADFVVEDEALDVIITSGNDTHSAAIANWIDENTVELDVAVPFDASGATITIVAGGRNGLLVGEFGLSLTSGSWAANHDDSTTAQLVASNPNGSTVGSGNPHDPPDGGVECVRSDMRVRMHRSDRQIEELAIKHTQVGNLTASGNLRPNTVLQKKPDVADTLIEIHAGGRRIFCTPSEPFFRDFSDFDRTTPAHEFREGDTIAMNPDGRDSIEEITFVGVHFGRFEIDHYVALAPGHVSIIEGFYVHNIKFDPPLNQ